MAQIRRSGSGVIEVLRFILVALGGILLLATLVTVSAMVVKNAGLFPVETLALKAAILLAGGTTFGTSLWAFAAILALLEKHQSCGASPSLDNLRADLARMHNALENLAETRPANDIPAAAPEPLPTTPAISAELLQLLRQLRDLLLMAEPQRSFFAQRHWTRRKQLALAAIHQHLAAGNWVRAGETLDELQSALPDDPDLAALAEQLAAGRETRMQEDVAAGQDNIRHLMSISAWDQAAQLAADLERQYPLSAQAAQIQADVQRERAAIESEDIERLFLDLADATEHRQWRRAAGLADEILRRYPSDRRADKLRHDLATLRENAAAQERKEQEELFKDLLKRQRYEEAVEVARSVIHKYPLSPAAAELMRLLPKVEEILRAEQAKRATL